MQSGQTVNRRLLIVGIVLMLAFILFTVLVRTVDVQPVGPISSYVGFATINADFHKLTGEHMNLNKIGEWLNAVPLLIAAAFGVFGLLQWIRRGSLKRVDRDIIVLGIYFVLVIAEYLLFEKLRINFRPMLDNGVLEASYPSSTALIVLSVMPVLIEQTARRVENRTLRSLIIAVSAVFALGMVIARLICGMHWLTDILGGILLSAANFALYLAFVGKSGQEA